jgi:hypothetical protein
MEPPANPPSSTEPVWEATPSFPKQEKREKWAMAIVAGIVLLLFSSTCILIGILIKYSVSNVPLAEVEKLIPVIATPTQLPNPQLHPGVTIREYPFNYGQTWPTNNSNNEFAIIERSIKDGEYHWVAEAKQGFFSKAAPEFRIPPPKDYYQVSVDVRVSEGPPDVQYGLVFAKTGDEDFWTWEVSEDGTSYLTQQKNGEWQDSVVVVSPVPVRRGQTNTLTLKVSKDSVYFYVNGSFVGSYPLPEDATDNFLQGEVIGLCLELSNSGDKATLDFDNIVVSHPEKFEK